MKFERLVLKLLILILKLTAYSKYPRGSEDLLLIVETEKYIIEEIKD